MRVKIRKQPKEMNLNISSLMDILTILLLFLILSFDSQEQTVTPPDGFDLPDSSSELTVKLAVKVTISPAEVLVEDKAVIPIVGNAIRPRDLDANNIIQPLLRELQREKARLQSGAAVAQGEEDEAEIVYLEAAKGTRYDLLDRVLKTAAAAGFTKFRLAVNRKA